MFELTRQQQELMHMAALDILGDVGLEVGHPRLLDALAGIGARIDKTAMRARFGAEVVQGFLDRCPKINWEARRPRLAARASLYSGKYHDPETGKLVPFERRHLPEYFRLAKALPNVKSCFVTGCQWPVKPKAEPLWERFNAWKYGAHHAGALYPIEASEDILELCEVYAKLKGRAVREVAGGGVFLMSPLKLSKQEAAQFVWWWEKGFSVGIAHMTTAGLSAPVTLPGTVALHLAEAIAIALLRKACYGTEELSLDTMVSVADMRTMMRPYGRPELVVANRIMASMARFYHVDCWGHSGLCDAKLPSVEAGAQKAMTVVGTLLAGANAMVDAGTLGVDQVSSPVQLILDNEFAGAVTRILDEPEISPTAIACDVIREVGPGGLFTGTPHTAEHFRDELWEPTIWSREMLQAWEDAGSPLDTDKARRMYTEIMAHAPGPAVLTPDEENALMKVIRRVEAES